MAIMPKAAFSEPIRTSQSSTTSWTACTLGTGSLFTGQSLGWLDLHPGLPSCKLQSLFWQASLSPTCRFGRHYSIPHPKFASSLLQFLSSQPPCSKASQVIQPLVLRHLVTPPGTWQHFPSKRERFLRHAVCFQMIKFFINQIYNLIYLFNRHTKHLLL